MPKLDPHVPCRVPVDVGSRHPFSSWLTYDALEEEYQRLVHGALADWNDMTDAILALRVSRGGSQGEGR